MISLNLGSQSFFATSFVTTDVVGCVASSSSCGLTAPSLVVGGRVASEVSNDAAMTAASDGDGDIDSGAAESTADDIDDGKVVASVAVMDVGAIDGDGSIGSIDDAGATDGGLA